MLARVGVAVGRMSGMSQGASGSCLVAVVQMTSRHDKDHNFNTCQRLVNRAAAQGAKMVFLPEACDYIAESREASLQLAEPLDGPLVQRYRGLAKEAGVWLSLGGLHVKEEGAEKVSNTHLVIDSSGHIAASYVKTHLFSVHIPEKNLHLEECSFAVRGDGMPPPVHTPAGRLALAVCYDLRFPEVSLIQRRLGAQLLTFPSAFTVTTGLAHWEALLRARAIETQCYVIAAAQTGQHNAKRSSYGHAMVVDPWGCVVGQAREGEGLVVAEVDLGYLRRVRREMPVMTHRRHDLYCLLPRDASACESLPLPSQHVQYRFGPVWVPGSCVFLKTRLAHAFVNKKPVVPGHVLICPERPAKKVVDLTFTELADLSWVVQRAGQVIAGHFGDTAVQLGVQDGKAAGQTIDHVHLHLVPRGQVCANLQGHEDNVELRWREVEEMEVECGALRNTAKGMDLAPPPCDLPSQPKLLGVDDEGCTGDVGDEGCTGDVSLVVARTSAVVASVHHTPALPGHTVMTLTAPSSHLLDAGQLTEALWLAQLVQRAVTTTDGLHDFTIFCLAQEEQKLEVHLVPRREGDLARNDDIYTLLVEGRGAAHVDPGDLTRLARQLRTFVYQA